MFGNENKLISRTSLFAAFSCIWSNKIILVLLLALIEEEHTHLFRTYVNNQLGEYRTTLDYTITA